MIQRKKRNIVFFLLLVLAYLFSCERPDIVRIIKIETLPVTAYSSTNAIISGNIIDSGEGIKEFGHYWWAEGKEADPLIYKYIGSTTGNYASQILGLKPSTKYYVKAYAADVNGPVFGKVMQFTTLASEVIETITITTTEISAITTTSAQSGGNITSAGGSAITARGVCWNTTGTPTINDYKTEDGNGSGLFTSYITGLSPDTKYYVRAYATNSIDTAYGQEENFTTNEEVIIPPCEIPAGIDAIFYKPPSGTAPIIDGIEEETWDLVNPVAINTPLGIESPTLTCYWKGLWDNDNIYVLINVEDNDHYPAWETGGTSWGWEYDQPEIFFDVNDVLVDGLGPVNTNSGHYRFAPVFAEGDYGKTITTTGESISMAGIYAYILTGQNYVFECAINVSDLKNSDGQSMNITEKAELSIAVGFDITGIDQDQGITTARQRYVWMSGDGEEQEAWNSMDSCGKVIFCSEQPGSETGIFSDSRDGNTYNWVRIGNQVWMAENLAYLPVVNPPTVESYTEPYYYVYGYNGTNVSEGKATANYSTYGVLYNWPAAMNGQASSSANPSGVQGICPTGWHLPSDAEWTELTNYLGGESVAGGKLKEAGYDHWLSPNESATNSSGFTALPGSYRSINGSFYDVGIYGFWWSATENDATYAWDRYLGCGNAGVTRNNNNKENGFSVRCVRDD